MGLVVAKLHVKTKFLVTLDKVCSSHSFLCRKEYIQKRMYLYIQVTNIDEAGQYTTMCNVYPVGFTYGLSNWFVPLPDALQVSCGMFYRYPWDCKHRKIPPPTVIVICTWNVMKYGYVILQFWMVSHANVGKLIVFLDDASRQLTAMKILAECLGKGTVLFVWGIFGNTPWVWVFILIFIHRPMRALMWHSINIILEHSSEILPLLERRLYSISALWAPSLMQSINTRSHFLIHMLYSLYYLAGQNLHICF